MANLWSPVDLNPICAEQKASLTQCSQTGYMFLALVTQLFGGSIDQNSYGNQFSDGYSSDFSSGSMFGSLTSPAIETSILGPSQINYRPNRVSSTTGIQTATAGLGPVVPTSSFSTHITHNDGPEASNGLSESSLYKEPDFKFDFEQEYKNPFLKYGSSSRPTFGYNYVDPKSYYDADTADSGKVSVRAESKKDGKRRRKRQVEQYDFIIVGAGSAGCVLANRLSEVKEWKILLLEAGTEEPDVTSVPSFAPTLGRSSIDWNYRTQPEELTCRAQRGQTCAWLSGRVMGGSSAINYFVYMRGNKRDYDDWADLGNEGWSYSEVLPYFKKSENNRDNEAQDEYHHGVDGPLTVERFPYADRNVKMLLKAFQENGLPLTDFNGEQQIGAAIAQTTSEDGKRMSTNAAFIRPIRKNRPNLIIRTNAQVIEILIDSDEKEAYGVKYIQNGKEFEVYANKEVIVSAGSLNTPKILMLSGIGPEDALNELNIPVLQNSKVGYNLQDHVTTDAMLIRLTNKTSTLINGKRLLENIKTFYNSEFSYGPLAATGPVHITAFIRTEYADEDDFVPDIQFHFDGRNRKEFYSDPTTYLASNVFPFAYYDSINVRPILVSPKSRGYLTLNKTDPVFGQPLIYPRFFTVKQDIDTLIAGLRFATTLEETKAFKRNGAKFARRSVEACSNYKWGTYDYFSCLFTRYTTTIFHPSGTCKMGPHWDEEAVVDPRLRVYGIKHLRVADASIMPNIVRGNTNAAVIMIGEKTADMVKEDWHHNDCQHEPI